MGIAFPRLLSLIEDVLVADCGLEPCDEFDAGEFDDAGTGEF